MTDLEARMYPVTTSLRGKFQADPSFENTPDLVLAALEYVGSYEHGEADVQDLHPAFATVHEDDNRKAVQAVANVVFDFVAVVAMGQEE